MKKCIEIQKNNIDYTLKVSGRTRRMRLSVHCDGNLTVITPQNVDLGIIESFIIQKAEWILDKINYFKSSDRIFLPKNTKTNYLKYKSVAHNLVHQKIEKFNKIYNYKFNRVCIRNQKTRWGSCSNKGNLNFNYKIALVSEEMSDYIVVHELCHLYEFNHSQKFWNLVEKTIPNYKNLRRELRKGRFK